MNKIVCLIAACAAILIWSGLPILVKLAIAEKDVSLFLVERFAFSTLILIWIIPRVLSKIKYIRLELWILFTIVVGSNFYLQTWALSQISASWYVVIFSLNPILTLLFMRYKINRTMWLGMALATIGTYFFSITHGSYLSSISVYAILALFGGMCTWSIYTVLIKQFQTIYSDLELTTLVTTLAFIACLVVWMLSKFTTEKFTVQQLPQSMIIGIIVPAAYFLYSYAMRGLPIFTITIQYLEPVFSLILAVYFLSDKLTHAQYLSGAVIFIGSLLASDVLKIKNRYQIINVFRRIKN